MTLLGSTFWRRYGAYINRSVMCLRLTCPGVSDIRDLQTLMRISHYIDVIMGVMASQITSVTIVYPAVNSGENQRKHQSPASLDFVRGIHRSQMASNAENVSIWWRHHETLNMNIFSARRTSLVIKGNVTFSWVILRVTITFILQMKNTRESPTYFYVESFHCTNIYIYVFQIKVSNTRFLKKI